MIQPLLRLKNIRKQFDAVVAVDAVNLDIGKGEFVTFLGPSGSGKTTTLMMVAGFEKATQGEMWLDEKPLDPLPAYERKIGMVFQHYALFPHMTVFKNVAFPLEMRKVPKKDVAVKVNEVLQLVGLPAHGERYPKQLSGGQQQRVALARAMVFKPRLLLMDEPLGALDKKLREHMQIEIMRLHRDLGITILYVTHDQEEALIMSDRIAVFSEGQIEQVGSPDDLYENPKTRFVADFIGESNFLPGKVTEISNGLAKVDSVVPVCGRPNEGVSMGKTVSVTVRPERIHIQTQFNSGADSPNKVKATVSDIIYIGQGRKYIAALPGGEELSVLVQAGVSGLEDIRIGSEINVFWSPENCKILA